MNANHPANILILQSSLHKTTNSYACTHICLIFAGLQYLTKKFSHQFSVFSEISLLLPVFSSILFWYMSSISPLFLSLSNFFFNQVLDVFHGPQHGFLHIGRHQLLQYTVISFCFHKTLTLSGFSSLHCLSLLWIDFPLHLVVLHPLLPSLSHGN